MKITGINKCVVYILQGRKIIERPHLFSVYQEHAKVHYNTCQRVCSTCKLIKEKTTEHSQKNYMGILCITLKERNTKRFVQN